MIEGLKETELRIVEAYGRRKAAALALCHKYAQEAEKMAKARQGTALGKGNVWINRTGMAVKSITGSAADYGGSVVCRVAHHMEYGKWLELANNRELAVLEPVIKDLAPALMDEARKIFQG